MRQEFLGFPWDICLPVSFTIFIDVSSLSSTFFSRPETFTQFLKSCESVWEKMECENGKGDETLKQVNFFHSHKGCT